MVRDSMFIVQVVFCTIDPMKIKRLYTLLAALLMIGLGTAIAQNMTEIHYFSDIYHGPNSVCQSCDGNILVECDLVNEGVNIGSKLL